MSQNLLRVRDGQGASVSFSELLFDLIYVFAVTQLSHYLLHHLTLTGALETLLLWFAVWLARQYTARVTNWFNPDTRQIRLLLFAIMLLGLFAAAALPQAFGERGLIFALFYVAIQVGRSVTVLRLLVPGHPLKRNFHRILGWLCISAVFWIAGGLAEEQRPHGAVGGRGLVRIRLADVRLPATGAGALGQQQRMEHRGSPSGGALPAVRDRGAGETILITGATLSEMESWNLPVLIASLVAFLGSGDVVDLLRHQQQSRQPRHQPRKTPASWALTSITCTSRWWGRSSSAPWPTSW